MKLAVSVIGLFKVIGAEDAVPVYEPAPVPVNPKNIYPVFATAFIVI